MLRVVLQQTLDQRTAVIPKPGVVVEVTFGIETDSHERLFAAR